MKSAFHDNNWMAIKARQDKIRQEKRWDWLIDFVWITAGEAHGMKWNVNGQRNAHDESQHRRQAMGLKLKLVIANLR